MNVVQVAAAEWKRQKPQSLGSKSNGKQLAPIHNVRVNEEFYKLFQTYVFIYVH